MAQRNSPLRLRFAEGELTVSAQTQDIGEAREALPGAVCRRSARDRLQRGVPARRARVDRVADGQGEADQPAPPGRAPGRDADYTVPDHADPARRLIVAGVTLRSFRSYASLELDAVAGIVLVVGANGAGKTNLLEALHVGDAGLLAAHAHRRAADPARRDGRLRRAGRSATGTIVEPRAGRAARARGEGGDGERRAALRRPTRCAERFSTLVFTPDRLAIVKGGPVVRRAYFDRVLGRLQPALALAPAGLRGGAGAAKRRAPARAARRRPSARRSSRGRRASPGSARRLVEARAAAIAALAPGFAERAGELGLRRREARLRGDRPVRRRAHARLDRDIARGTTGLGPHLDDVEISAG